MPDLAPFAWLVPALPLVGALVAAIGGRRLGENAALPVILGIALAFFVSLGLLLGGSDRVEVVFPWLEISGLHVPITFQLSGITTMMLAMITFVASFIATFAKGYMAGDPGGPRFFALVGLFVTMMTGLVLSGNFVVTYLFWEGVGVCSYLLVGYYHDKPSAAAAAQKAFLVNRIGDVGFALAIFWMWRVTPSHSLNYDAVLDPANLAALSDSTRIGIALLLFWAATAKSAQIPLYTWLPDAMEGPTPVSALIHAATMVTAGVYLLARSSVLLVSVPAAQLVIAVIGCLTALVAATIAVTQTDLKRILAYSTVSQLGFMFMALGAGVGSLAEFAMIAALFHLFTHAFFKALLFLGSGSVMHAMGGVIDIRRFGGLAARMPVTCLTFLIGALALAGIFPLAGFFSKDEILVALRAASHEADTALGAGWGWAYSVIYVLAIFTAFLTAFYIGRAFILTFLGPERLPTDTATEAGHEDAESVAQDHAADPSHDHGHGHGHEIGHESPPIMRYPLIVLAVGTVVVGMLFGPTGLFGGHVVKTPGFTTLEHAEHHGDTLTIVLGTLAGLLGIGLSLVVYGRDEPIPETRPAWYRKIAAPLQPLGRSLRATGAALVPLGRRLTPLYDAAAAKYGVDEFYAKAIVGPTRIVSKILSALDVVLLDPLVRGLAALPRIFGRDVLAKSQNGLVQTYAASAALGVAGVLAYLLLSI